MRYQSAADLRADFVRLKRGLDTSSVSSSVAAAAPRTLSLKYVAIAVAAILAIAVAAGFYFTRAKPDTKKISSIAVLPFVNATADPGNEYLSDGLTESLIGTLSQLPDLKVLARSTVFRFKGKEDDPRQIGQGLQVSAVLMGRITQHGDDLGIDADLVDTADGAELWGSHYARKATDVAQVQGDITRDISSRLRIHLSGNEKQRLTRAATSNPEAYRLYLEGRQAWYGRTPDGLKKSIVLFQQAIAADPNYALAYTGLADTYNVAPSYGIGVTSKQGEIMADDASRKAVELDDALSEAHAARAFASANLRRWSEAELEFRRALDLNPNNAAAHYFYAFGFLAPQNRMGEGLEQYRNALSLDPLSSIVNTNYAVLLMEARRYPESLTQFQKVLARDPGFGPAHYKLSQFYATTGRFADAVAELQGAFPKPIPVSADAKGYLQLVSLLQGTDRATAMAVAAALLENRDLAFQYLEQAYGDGDNELLIAIRYPAFDPLRSDPRYKDLMRRLGLPE